MVSLIKSEMYELNLLVLFQFVSSHHGTGITYSIEGEGANTIFQIDNKTGELFAVEPLDRENKSSYHLYVSS